MTGKPPILLAIALAAAPLGAQAQDLDAARRFVGQIYAAYCDDCQGPGFDSPRLLSPRLLELVRRDRRLTPAGDVGALDGDPICDCQDWRIRKLTIEVQAAGADRALAVARFVNAGEPTTIKLDLLSVRGRLRIDNIRSKTVPDLADFLRRHAGGR